MLLRTRLAATLPTLALAVVLTAAGGDAFGGEAIVVQLAGGGQIQGEPDEATDASRLWLRRESAGIQLTSGFPWQQIEAVQRGDEWLSARQFLAIADRTKSPGKTYAQLVSGAIATPAPPASPAIETAAATDLQPSPHAVFRRAAANRRVQSLYIEAYLAQWDGDPQADGLRVFIYPLAADGELVPVNGQIELFLMGEIERATGLVAAPPLPQFRELERTSQLVRPGDFAGGHAVVELPFRQFHPDFYFDVARQALVHARLGVPGQGLFLASDANVQLRTFSRFRDELQMHTRQRYLPVENAIER